MIATARSRRSIRPLETHIQQAVIAWKWLAIGQWPELALLHSTPNGSFRGKDRKAAAINAARLKAEGMVPGWPDLCLPVARPPFIGLAIEMKRPGEPASDDQVAVLEQLSAAGHLTAICRSADEAIGVLRAYLLRAVDPAGLKPVPTLNPPVDRSIKGAIATTETTL